MNNKLGKRRGAGWAFVLVCALGAALSPAILLHAQPADEGRTPEMPDILRLESQPVTATQIGIWFRKAALSIEEENAKPLLPTEGPELVYEKARRMIRVLSGQFFEAASKPNPMDQVQGLYGFTIINNMELIQGRMRRVIDDMASNNPVRVQQSQMSREAMDHLAALDGKLGMRPLLEEPSEMEHHLSRFLSDLYTLHRRNDRAVGNTWSDPVFICWDGADSRTGPLIDYYKFLRGLEIKGPELFNERIDRIVERLKLLKRASAARETAVSLVEAMRPAALVPKFRARLDQVLTDMERLTEFLETLDRTTWLSPAVVAGLELESGKMMALYAQPRDRAAALPWMADLFSIRPAIEVINNYKAEKQRLDTTSIEAAINTAAGINPTTQPRVTRQRVMHWINQLACLLDERVQILKAEPPAEYRVLVGRADAAFMTQLQQHVLIICRSIAAKPQAVEEPQTVVQLNVLRQRLLELRYVKQVPVWVQAAEEAKVQPSFGFARRFKSAADALGGVDRKNTTDAFDDLNQFNLQFSRYMLLPGEARLRDEVSKQGKSSLPSIGDRGRILLQVIDENRAAWLGNWARDMRPRTAGRRMIRVALLMRYISALESARNARHGADALNSWPAMEIDHRQLQDPIKRALDAVTGAVIRVTDNPDVIADPDLLSYDKVPWSLVVTCELGRQFRNIHGDRQWDMEYLMAELFYQPRPASWVNDRRIPLARLSNAINAGAWRAFVFGTATVDPMKMEGNPDAQFLRETDIFSERVLTQDEFLNLAP